MHSNQYNFMSFYILSCLRFLLFLTLSCRTGQTLRLNMHQNDYLQNENQSVKKMISKSLQSASIFFTGALLTSQRKPSLAVTYFDTDVYGDKELKIATVNKMKQKIRNEVLNDITLAPVLLKLAVNDALGFSSQTQEGGPDGSILFEMDREVNKGLEKGIAALKRVQEELKRTNTVGFGDLVSFAGVVSLESVGCGRLTTQIGRFDAKKANSKSSLINWINLSESEVFQAFQESGLDKAEAILMLSAIGETERIVRESLEARTNNDEDDEYFEPQPFIPTTFGTPDEIFGERIGKGDFSSEYIKSLLSKKTTSPLTDPISSFLLSYSGTKSFLAKYIGNDQVYRKDVAAIYLKVTTLGSQFTTRNS